MVDEDTTRRVALRVAEVLALDPEDVLPGSRLMDDLGADSLDLVELMYLLENEFDIRLTQQDMSLTAQLGISEEQIHTNEVPHAPGPGPAAPALPPRRGDPQAGDPAKPARLPGHGARGGPGGEAPPGQRRPAWPCLTQGGTSPPCHP